MNNWLLIQRRLFTVWSFDARRMCFSSSLPFENWAHNSWHGTTIVCSCCVALEGIHNFKGDNIAFVKMDFHWRKGRNGGTHDMSAFSQEVPRNPRCRSVFARAFWPCSPFLIVVYRNKNTYSVRIEDMKIWRKNISTFDYVVSNL